MTTKHHRRPNLAIATAVALSSVAVYAAPAVTSSPARAKEVSARVLPTWSGASMSASWLRDGASSRAIVILRPQFATSRSERGARRNAAARAIQSATTQMLHEAGVAHVTRYHLVNALAARLTGR